MRRLEGARRRLGRQPRRAAAENAQADSYSPQFAHIAPEKVSTQRANLTKNS